MSDYPSRGEAWADFRHHRTRVIVELVAEGNSYEVIASMLSIAALQVKIIHVTHQDRTAIRSAGKEAG